MQGERRRHTDQRGHLPRLRTTDDTCVHNPARFPMETALLVLEIDSILERQRAPNA
jgi:hypothetical protein